MNNPSMYGTTPYYPTYPTPNYMPTSTFQPNVQPSLINGRPVDSLEEITAGEVPLNGSLAIFPKKDGSIIYVKSTNGNGTIDTRCYVPANDGFVDHPGSSAEDTPMISNQDLMSAILNIQDQMSDIQQVMQKSRRNNTKPNNQNGNKDRVNNE